MYGEYTDCDHMFVTDKTETLTVKNINKMLTTYTLESFSIKDVLM